MQRRRQRQSGFTILEMIVVIAIVGILFAVVTLLINPARQFAKTNNGARRSHLGVILGAMSENTSDHKGSFDCATGPLPTSTMKMAAPTATSTDHYDIAPCLVPAYLAALPHDPTAAGARWASTTDYDTGYTVVRNEVNGQITLTAPDAELGETIFLTH